ncbi:DUF3322 and DUF2220 domain-containing protein [Nocardioides sp. WS12]|uniref:DUF3322 and DUF2220 domain-containing protein n=1 Tax=Nocardioides sp. WS12 TaxID=2486272 RepID=UPI0015FAB454|nr:DUF3322 and DUF2220 domain-containing protein [Nocardioides sp. WS12]
MKGETEVVASIGRRLQTSWAEAVLAEARGIAADRAAWPNDFPLGRKKSAEMATGFSDVVEELHAWRDWAAAHGVELIERTRRVSGVAHQIHTHIRVESLDDAARVAGDGWPERLERGRRRAGELLERFPNQTRSAWMLNATAGLFDVEFGLLLDVAAWFADSTAEDRAQRTPRQVPVEGIHAKWLSKRKALVAELAGLESLGLMPDHPARIHFTYLDEDYLTTGGRKYDSASVGDPVALPYVPRVVLISENKDTAVGFPSVPGGIAIEGGGSGATTHAKFDFILDAPVVVYWGDMDADGLEILNQFRGAGVAKTSMLMDLGTFEAWARFGTNVDKYDQPLGARDPKPVEHLEGPERALYAALISADWPHFRRVEQERIPLGVALAKLLALVDK